MARSTTGLPYLTRRSDTGNRPIGANWRPIFPPRQRRPCPSVVDNRAPGTRRDGTRFELSLKTGDEAILARADCKIPGRPAKIRERLKVPMQPPFFGNVPSEAAVTRLVDAILLEQNDEWSVQRARYMTLETITALSDDPLVNLPLAAA